MSRSDSASCQFIWVDGSIVPQENAGVHLLSHSLHYGGAVFEGIRAYEGQDGTSLIFRAKEHFERLFQSMQVFGYVTQYSVQDYITATCETIRKNQLKNCYIRPIIYLDQTFRGLQLPETPKALSAIAAWDWGSYMGEEAQKKGIRVKFSKFRRSSAPKEVQEAKIAGGYVTSLLARREADSSGFDEAILLDPEGNIAEGPGENIFIARGKTLLTPKNGFILPGITRSTISSLAQDLGFEVVESCLSPEDLNQADEVFFTGTAVEVTGIREIEGHTIGSGSSGPITQQLSKAYMRCVRGELDKYRDWVTPV